MKKIVIVLLITFSFVSNTFGAVNPNEQISNYTKSILPPSPDSWSMIKVEFPQTNEFKRLYVVLLVDFKQVQNINLPISLSYSSKCYTFNK